MLTKSLSLQLVALLFVVGLVSTACNASIDKSPVKVTNRNSGPSYDLSEDVERVKIPADDENSFEERRKEFASGFPRFTGLDSSSPNTNNKDSQAESGMPTPDIGRISIRRIFIVPVMPPASSSDDNDNQGESSGASSQSSFNPFESMLPFMMMRPTMAGPQQSDMSEQPSNERRHLFGSDSRSRNPFGSEPPRSQESSGEREEPSRYPVEVDKSSLSPDPMQLLRFMLRTFQEAQNHMSSLPDAAVAPASNNNNTQRSTDLEKSASSNEKHDQTNEPNPFAGIFGEVPKKPATQNETREEVVEIEGKKYLRKTVINRHVGENMIFVTRRLVFVPLNETDSTATTENSVPITTLTPSTTVAETKEASTPASTTTIIDADTSTTAATPVIPKKEELTTTTTTVSPITVKTKEVSEPKP